MSDVTITLEDDELVIRLPANTELASMPASKSGKTRIVASTHGGLRTGVEVDGQPLTLSLNAYVPNPDR